MKIAPVVLFFVLMGVCVAEPFLLFEDMFRQQRALMRIFARAQAHTAQAMLGGGSHHSDHHDSEHHGHHGKLHHGRHHSKKHHKKSRKAHKFMRLHHVLARLHRRGQTRRMQRLRDLGKWFG
ncbi:uncharacterized protein LOC110677854 [Aedes aegypti]|uniref:Uncharacterized protein n=1 Tax=Aedes aegypti TaxID=7159 RepID=A0A6I8UA49_AEDAE|nr:uncharacterized protein LOC110677854 [Aedes aegypti]